jgi:hypothetical protein
MSADDDDGADDGRHHGRGEDDHDEDEDADEAPPALDGPAGNLRGARGRATPLKGAAAPPAILSAVKEAKEKLEALQLEAQEQLHAQAAQLQAQAARRKTTPKRGDAPDPDALKTLTDKNKELESLLSGLRLEKQQKEEKARLDASHGKRSPPTGGDRSDHDSDVEEIGRMPTHHFTGNTHGDGHDGGDSRASSQSDSTSSKYPPRPTAEDYARAAADLHENMDKKDEVTLPKYRHGKTEPLSDRFILWLRNHKLKSEIECNKSFPTQLEEMMTSMQSHNPALYVQMLWALNVIEEDREMGDSIPLSESYLWERYVVDNMKDNGFLCNRWQFNTNTKMIKTIMTEWTKTEDGETIGSHTVPRHTQNQFTGFVSMQISQNTAGIKILRDIRFLFEGNGSSTLYRAYVALFSIPAEKCPDVHQAWQEIMHRVNEVHINIPT